jgi:RNA polymerase sigma factor (sigma-70 family)
MMTGNSAAFPPTRWSWIRTAVVERSPEGREALAELCRAYWYPIYALIRRQGYSASDASDLTQDYFVRLIEGGQLRAADPTKGRFRTFLRTDCRYFLADQRDRQLAQKRGGGKTWISLDVEQAEARFAMECAAAGPDPDRLFDRAWALGLIDRAFERLAREEAEAGRGGAFEHLKVILTDGPRTVPYATIAEALGTTVAAVQSGVVRLRERYRAAFRAEVAATLHQPSEADLGEEVRWMLDAIAN